MDGGIGFVSTIDCPFHFFPNQIRSLSPALCILSQLSSTELNGR